MSQIANTIFVTSFPSGVQTEAAIETAESALDQLREEYNVQQALFEVQPLATQRHLEEQACQIAQALMQSERQVRLALPEQVVIHTTGKSGDGLIAVPPEFRNQVIAGLLGRLPVKDIRAAVRQRLARLEQSPHPAVAASAKLIRHATVSYMVHRMLSAGHPVTWLVTASEVTPASSAADPAVTVADRFYMPEWVAFDGGHLLAGSVAEAEARVAAMQQYLRTLHLAVSLAPYIFADEEYQRKRYGMLGQLINQGRALARYWTKEIIGKLQRKAEEGELDRGLSLSLPYFDDQMLEMRMFDFEVIPSGRTMFVPAFVVLAARREQAKVMQDAHLSYPTRMHLLSELKAMERAFELKV